MTPVSHRNTRFILYSEGFFFAKCVQEFGTFQPTATYTFYIRETKQNVIGNTLCHLRDVFIRRAQHATAFLKPSISTWQSEREQPASAKH